MSLWQERPVSRIDLAYEYLRGEPRESNLPELEHLHSDWAANQAPPKTYVAFGCRFFHHTISRFRVGVSK